MFISRQSFLVVYSVWLVQATCIVCFIILSSSCCSFFVFGFWEVVCTVSVLKIHFNTGGVKRVGSVFTNARRYRS